MGQYLWFIYAVASAVLWGLSYALSERALKLGVSPSFLLLGFVTLAFPFYAAIGVMNGTLKQGISLILENKSLLFIFVMVALSYIVANFLIMKSVEMKNATLVSAVEVAYPMFTALFVWFLYKEVQINIETLAGMMLIIVGAALIVLKS